VTERAGLLRSLQSYPHALRQCRSSAAIETTPNPRWAKHAVTAASTISKPGIRVARSYSDSDVRDRSTTLADNVTTDKPAHLRSLRNDWPKSFSEFITWFQRLLRHSYATWLVDDGVPPNMVQRVMGHERSSTTLDLYTRRTDNSDRILEALTDPDDNDSDDDPDDGTAGVLAPV